MNVANEKGEAANFKQVHERRRWQPSLEDFGIGIWERVLSTPHCKRYSLWLLCYEASAVGLPSNASTLFDIHIYRSTNAPCAGRKAADELGSEFKVLHVATETTCDITDTYLPKESHLITPTAPRVVCLLPLMDNVKLFQTSFEISNTWQRL